MITSEIQSAALLLAAKKIAKRAVRYRSLGGSENLIAAQEASACAEVLRKGAALFRANKKVATISTLARPVHLEACEHSKGRHNKPHPCPYLEDLNGDKKTKCRCCKGCQQLCADNL